MYIALWAAALGVIEMVVGIMGSGKVGSALGAWFAKTGITVMFVSGNQDDALAAAENAGYGAICWASKPWFGKPTFFF